MNDKVGGEIQEYAYKNAEPLADIHKEVRDQKEINKRQLAYKNALQDLQSLAALSQTKKQIDELREVIAAMAQCASLKLQRNFKKFPWHLAIIGQYGTGKKTIARVLAKIFYFYEIIDSSDLVVIDGSTLHKSFDFSRDLKQHESGIIYINNFDYQVEGNQWRCESTFNHLFEEIKKLESKYIFMFSGSDTVIEKLFETHGIIKNIIQFVLTIPPYTEDELFEMAKDIAYKQGFTIHKTAKDNIMKQLKAVNTKEYNYYLIEATVRKAIMKKVKSDQLLQGLRSHILVKANFEVSPSAIKSLNKEEKHSTALEELENLIGMDAVKKVIYQIHDYLKVQMMRRKQGLVGEPLSLHMQLVGNPGTGKTTIARILGKLFHELGIFKEHIFIEATRETLVAGFIGQSAGKTTKVLNEAMGGTLFIDEAYSLHGGGEKDYGNEVVATIIKRMEDARDQIAVIFAGYNKEMEKFINMNSGLRDRIQFNIHFIDYKPDEMTEIFRQFAKKQQYHIEEAAIIEIARMFESIYEKRDQNFANARLVRKCFDRVKIIQATRIIKNDYTQKEQLLQVELSDILHLYEEEYIRELLGTANFKIKKIGFLA